MFFSTTVQPFMPHFRISEHYYGKRYKEVQFRATPLQMAQPNWKLNPDPNN
jgi:hypothetical protein